MIEWLQANDDLSGWAQFAGAMLALIVTYITAFAPIWRRKRQLRRAVERLLANGYEVLESYSRTSEFGTLNALSVRQAALSIGLVSHEIGSFPMYDIHGQGSNSIARRLTAMRHTLAAMKLILDDIALELEARSETVEDREKLRHMLQLSVTNARAFMLGEMLSRPTPPVDET